MNTQKENPNGLHARFYLQRIVGWDSGQYGEVPILEPVSINAEYFVLRLDSNGSDPKHVAACRAAVLKYAEEIKDHIPQLSKDLIERYSNTKQ